MAYNYEYPYTDYDRANSDWILHRIKEIVTKIDDLEAWKTTHKEEYKELKDLYDDITSGVFPQSIIDGLNEWMINRGGLELIQSLVKGVYFGLTDDGYFIAYIPDTWNDITFKTTGYDYEDPIITDYGHLVLLY